MVGLALYHTHRYHGTRSLRDQWARTHDSTTFEHQIHLLKTQMSELLKECSDCADLAIRGLLDGDRESLEFARRQVGNLQKSCERKELIFVRVLKRVQPEVDGRLLGLLEALACQQDLFQTVENIVYTARQHVLNAHEQLTPETRQTLHKFNEIQCELVKLQISEWASGRDNPNISTFLKDLEELLTHSTHSAVDDLYSSVRPIKFTTLLLTMLTEFTDYVRELERARKLWDNYIDTQAEAAANPVT